MLASRCLTFFEFNLLIFNSILLFNNVFKVKLSVLQSNWPFRHPFRNTLVHKPVESLEMNHLIVSFSITSNKNEALGSSNLATQLFFIFGFPAYNSYPKCYIFIHTFV